MSDPAQQLLAHFDRISEAPEAVQRLRRFILDLAVRGKLVEQDPNDEPASSLLRDRQLLPDPDSEPWVLPPGWAWSSYALVGDTIGGGTPEKANPAFWNGSIPWVSPKDMKVDFVGDAQDHISEMAVEQSSARLIPAGSLLMVVRGMILAHSFPVAVSTVPVTINQDMKAVVPFRPDLARALLLISKGMKPEVMRLVQRSTHGTCKLLTGDLFSLPLPVPPLAEQHRILAKVDELMALCDPLEAAQTERETRRDRLVAASLNRLNEPAGTDADDAQPFRDHARFHLRHLPRLTTRPEHIQQLRQTILNLAVRGRLAPQGPDIERPAIAGGTSSVRRGDVSIEERKSEAGECPFTIPSSWRWRRLQALSELVTDGEHATPPRISEAQVPLVTAKNVRDGFMDCRDTDWVSFATAEKAWKRCHPVAGDILLVCVGATTGRLCVLTEPQDMVLVRSVALIRPAPAIGVEYLARVLRSPTCQAQIWAQVKVTAQPCLYINRMRSLLIPLPPLAEQHRIVARIDELMALCDRLEAQLTTTQTESRLLLEAALHQALAPPAAQAGGDAGGKAVARRLTRIPGKP